MMRSGVQVTPQLPFIKSRDPGDLTLVSQAFSDQTVQLRIKDGDDGERYRVTVRCAFDNGDELEAEGELQVRNIR